MRIVFSTFGTFGDINPLIALSLELKRRGHTPVITAPAMFRGKIEPLGIEFAAVRPDQDPSDKRMVEMVYDIKKGTETGLREFLFPAIRDSYDDLLAAVQANGGADLLVTGELAYAGPIVADKTGIPWVSYVLAPLSFFSGYDPPVLPPFPTLAKVQSLVPGVGRLIPYFARLVTRRWPEPIYALRKELGLPRGKDPLFDAKHSERLVLAMFSRVLGDPQPDWPASTRITGFAFYDGDAGNTKLAPELEAAAGLYAGIGGGDGGRGLLRGKRGCGRDPGTESGSAHRQRSAQPAETGASGQHLRRAVCAVLEDLPAGLSPHSPGRCGHHGAGS
jgi:rhamnosyltransferase subunit B